MSSQTIPAAVDQAEIEALLERLASLRREIGKAIIGQEETVEHLLWLYSPAATASCRAYPGWPRR